MNTNEITNAVRKKNSFSTLTDSAISSLNKKLVQESFNDQFYYRELQEYYQKKIKKEEENFKAESFVFASDFSEETRAPFEMVANFANKFNSHLHLVTINTPNNFKSTRVAEKIMNDFTSQVSIKNFSTHIYNDINVEKGILHFAKSIDADIIGMSTHGRKGISHFFNGSISEDLVNHAKRPVVTFKI